MVPLFDLLYGAQSDLLWRDCILSSSEGTRQGDVLGPALFALAIQPILDTVHHAFPSVSMYAYMEDVTIASHDEGSLRGAFTLLCTRAAEVGLLLNNTKTVAHGPLSAALAPHLAITYSPFGVKILGAWISLDKSSTDEFIRRAVEKHALFFEALAGLDSEIAFAILRFCGWPRINYLCRVTPNMGAHAKTFDATVLTSLMNIAGIEQVLTLHQEYLISLPLKLGGLGLRRYSDLAPECYAASVDPTSTSEEARTKLIDDATAVFVDTDPVWKEHRAALMKRHASAWLQSPSSNFTFRNQEFVRALQLRLRASGTWAAGKSLQLCPCGFAVNSPAALELHLVGCASILVLAPQHGTTPSETPSGATFVAQAPQSQWNLASGLHVELICM